MTLRERFQIIGQGLLGKTQQVKKVVPKKKEKDVLGGFIDFQMNQLSDETKVSKKLLAANTGWVFRNNDVIAKEVAQLEYELYSVRVVGKELDFVEIDQHPLLEVLDRMNEFTTKYEGLYTTTSHRNLAGDAFWLKDGSGVNLKNLYILPPDKVELVLGKVEGTQRIIQGYHYRDSIKGDPVDREYAADEVIHFKVPDPKNSYRGYSKVAAAADVIDLDNYSQEAQKALYKRGLINNFVLSTDNRVTPEQMKELRAELKANYSGVDNAFKAMILGGGLEPKTIQQSNKEMEQIAQQEWVRDKITAIFGNSKAVIGVTDDVNRANADASLLHWKRTTVKSEMQGIVDTLNEFLVPEYGSNLLLTFCSPVPEDDASDTDNITKLVQSNIITINEARQMMDIDPIKDPNADQLRQSGSSTDPIPKSIENVSYQKHLRRMGIYKSLENRKNIIESLKPIAKKMVKKPKVKEEPQVKFTSFGEQQAWDYYNKQMDIIETHEVIFQNKVEKYIDRLIEKVLSNVPEEVADMQRKQLFNEDQELEEAKKDFTPILVAVSVAARQLALQLINFDKPLIDTGIEAKVAERVTWFAKSMLDTDKDKLIDIISEGVQQGQSIPNIRNTITETFATYSKTQAERVARTEVAHASVQASIDAWSDSGVVEGYEWIVASPNDECLDYAGMVKDSPDDFPEGAPPIHPNCKCDLIPVLKDEKGMGEFFKEKAFEAKITELESKIDKRTKKYRELKEKNLEQVQYITELEEFIDG